MMIAATHGGLGFNIMEVIVTTGPGTLTTLLKVHPTEEESDVSSSILQNMYKGLLI